jgi:hypothetical protein
MLPGSFVATPAAGAGVAGGTLLATGLVPAAGQVAA